MGGWIGINGVDKRELSSGLFEYAFPVARLIADNNNSNTITFFIATVQKPIEYSLLLADIPVNYGATTAEQYCDTLATLGAYGGRVVNTPTSGGISFLENRIVVNQSNYLTALQNLDSLKEYFLDGTVIVDGSLIDIEIPPTGWNLKGYNSSLSVLVLSGTNETLLQSPVGGSGDIRVSGVTFVAGGSGNQVFGLTDSDGTHTVELSDVGFINCSSLGEVNGYQQYIETLSARIGQTPELTFSGSIGGVRITTAVARGMSDFTSLFKAGAGFSIGRRFITDVACDLPANGALIDFAPSNFTNDESCQIKNATVTRQGVINPSDSTITPNIAETSTFSLWRDNSGVPNTTKELEARIVTEATTVISTSGQFEVLQGIWSVIASSHWDMPVNGQFRLLTSADKYSFMTNLVIDGGPNDQIAIRVMKSEDDGVTFPVQAYLYRTQVNSLLGGRDVAMVNVSFLVTANKNDRFRLEIANLTDTTNVTAEIDSYVFVRE